MKNKNSNSLMLLTGIIAGGAAVYFLQSPKGKEVVNLLMEKGDGLKSAIADQSKEILDQGKTILDTAIKTGESLMENTSEQVALVGDHLKEDVHDSLSDFQQGIEKAKNKLKNT